VTQAPLIQPSDLLLYGAGSDFCAYFQPRPLSARIATGGVLGTMAIEWQVQGDTSWAGPIVSEGGASWQHDLSDPGFGSIVFPAGSYLAGWQYVIGTSGISGAGSWAVPVTPAAGAPAGPTATRFDLRLVVCQATTAKAVTWMQPRVIAPVESVGPDVKEWLAAIAIYTLKSRQGATPPGAGLGDENLRLRAVEAEENLKQIGRSEVRPPDLVDSSSGAAGGGFSAYPVSDDLRRW
jgi:hypothetical protein